MNKNKPLSHKRSALLTFGVVLIGLSVSAPVQTQTVTSVLNQQLIEAAEQGNISEVINLINAGADPNARVLPQTFPPLSRQNLRKYLWLNVIHPFNTNATSLMLVCGALWFDKNGKYRFASSAIRPEEHQLEELVQTMLKHGLKVNLMDAWGETALMHAAGFGSTAITTLLLEHHAAIDVQDDRGNTALFDAVLARRTEVVELLLKYHANVRLKNREGETPLHMAAQHLRLMTAMHASTLPEASRIVRLLKQAGAKK